MYARSLGLSITAILLIVGGWFVRTQYSAKYNEILPGSIQKKLDDQFTQIDQEADRIIADHLSVASPAWDDAKHFFVQMDGNTVVEWNRTTFLPDLGPLSKIDSITFIDSPRGASLIKRWAIEDGSSLFCVLMLTDRYPIINNFLSSQWNADIFPEKDVQILAPYHSTGQPLVMNGKVAFMILPQSLQIRESTFSVLLLSMGVIVLLVVLWRLIRKFEKNLNFDLAFVSLFSGLISIRWGMILINLPGLYLSTDLFDPKKFASSSLNGSMGDLFFNSIALLALIGYLFLHFTKFRFVRWLLLLRGFYRIAAGTLCLLICFFGLLFPYDFIEAIYHNSTISLDIIQSLSFDTVRIVALSSVLCACISSFLFVHVFFSLSNHLFGRKAFPFFPGLLTALVLFGLQFFIFERNLSVTLILGIVFFSVLRLSKLYKTIFKISFRLFIYLIFSLIIYCFQNGYAVRIFNKERQVQDQFRFGKDFLTERDVLGEYLLDQARQRIEKDQFIQMRMASPFMSKAPVVDKIRRVHLSNYFDRYEIDIRPQIKSGIPSEETTSEASSNDLSRNGNFSPTGYAGISFANTSGANTIKRYHVTIPVFYQRPAGEITLDLSLKRVIPENVYPELLVDNRFNQIYRNRDFSYAVFLEDKLISSFGPFNYGRDFQKRQIRNPDLLEKGISDKQYYHIGIEDQDGSVVIVSAIAYSWFYFVTNFSFWFVFGLVFLFLGQGILVVYSYFRGEQFNYTARIQLFIFFAFLLPVLAVSITTLTLIGRSNEEAIEKDFLDRSIILSQRISNLISADSSIISKEANLERFIEENVATSKTDISVYSPEGKLLATSQPALFDDQLISPLIDREARKKIVLQAEVQTVTNEQIGRLHYSCAYSAVLSPETGRLEAIVGLPFFESATFLQRSQSLILSNILIVFVVVFILFSLLSFWASSSLTFPIRFITKTLGQTTLTGQNKPLQWNSSDEIGTLVKEYNRMVENLEDSKRALAKSEKESAWREMAKQVAHEIKNPLTPMKLTLQQMEQALRSGNLSIDKSQKSVDVLLKQVNILNEIAASFSTFASMPTPTSQKVDLNGLLQEAVNLFEAATDGTVSFSGSGSGVIVSVDPTSLNRAISNIIINALQAKHENQEVLKVIVSVTILKETVVITLGDNGRGMSPEVQEKVFQPQFTTKQSGSGLGLAMAKEIIGQAGGKIWFESTLHEGTSFFIELPLAD